MHGKMRLSGMNKPNFRTINRFRISLDVQYIDGTKIESVANKYTFVWKGSVEKNKSKLLIKVDAILKEDLKQRTDRILILTDSASTVVKLQQTPVMAVSRIMSICLPNGTTSGTH